MKAKTNGNHIDHIVIDLDDDALDVRQRAVGKAPLHHITNLEPRRH